MVCRVFLALALILNGTAMPPAVAMDPVSSDPAHAGHHLPGSTPGQPSTDDAGDLPGSCCDRMGCDCGCAGPQAVPFTAVAAPGAWDRAPALSVPSSTRLLPNLIAAPFRPPA
jgi:hypothetical protein